jgi:hypothetical protein
LQSQLGGLPAPADQSFIVQAALAGVATLATMDSATSTADTPLIIILLLGANACGCMYFGRWALQ